MGNVCVWPSAGSAGSPRGSVVNIELRSHNERARFEALANGISDFVRLTYQMVPAGERDHLNVECELTDLFS